MSPIRTRDMEEDGGGEPQETTFTGTPNAAPTESPVGAFDQQPEVQFVKRSSVPIIIGVIFSLIHGILLLGALMIMLGGAFLSSLGPEVDGASAAGIFALGLVLVLVHGSGIFGAVQIARYKKIGVKISLAVMACKFILDPIINVASGEEMMDGIGFSLVTNGICALIVAIPMLAAGISQQME